MEALYGITILILIVAVIILYCMYRHNKSSATYWYKYYAELRIEYYKLIETEKQ